MGLEKCCTCILLDVADAFGKWHSTASSGCEGYPGKWMEKEGPNPHLPYRPIFWL